MDSGTPGQTFIEFAVSRVFSFYHLLSLAHLTFLDSVNFGINEMAVVLTRIGTFHFFFFAITRE